MRVDVKTIQEMNKRILDDFSKVEQDRQSQIKKLILSYSRAMAESTKRVNQSLQ